MDRYTKNLISRVNHELSMLVNLSLAIRYGPSLCSGPNLMVLLKGLPTSGSYHNFFDMYICGFTARSFL